MTSDIQQSLFRLQRLGIDMRFCWVPAHVGIKDELKKIDVGNVLFMTIKSKLHLTF